MILRSPAETAAAGALLAGRIQAGDVLTLSGPLGVGKTELVRGLIEALGHQGEVPSPSFALVQPYDDLEPRVWHVDLYRIEDPAELVELGLSDAGDAALVIEWPERAGLDRWPDALQLALQFGADGIRILTAQVPPAWNERWPLR